MYPMWNAYYSPFMMPMPSFFPFFQPQIYANHSQLIPPNPVANIQKALIPEITKNTDKNTEQPSRSVIDISSDSESSIQQIQPPSILENKEPPTKKPKPDRFLGFKEGIFEKENNEVVKPTRNLRKRAVMTRARIRKYKGKKDHQKIKERKKRLEKPTLVRKLRESLRISKMENIQKIKNGEKKPRSREFAKLKKYLRGVGKTVTLPAMYSLKQGFLKELEEKRESLLLRQTD